MLSTGEKTNPGPLGKTIRLILVMYVLMSQFRGNPLPGSSNPVRCHVWPGTVPEWRPYRSQTPICI